MVIVTSLLVVLAVGAYLAVRSLAPVIGPVLTGSGCSAVSGHQSVLLDTQQASIASTIAGVAHQQSMPRAAVTIAYATAMQESKLHDLTYGDMDSVGVFQQRPSQGWGPARKLENPVYATTKFFRALKDVRGYQTMPVYRAAQAVQRSADGAAYIQYERMATEMAGAFTGQRGHAVYCWSSTAGPRHPATALITEGLTSTFGHATADLAASGPRRTMQVRIGHPKLGWEVTSWLVTHASKYGIHQVRFGGYQWRAAAGLKGWVRDAGAPAAGTIQLS
ncbi:MAG TPA: hypothetical protein VIF35_13660 [Streptosporangiaceae bacterium]